MTFLPLLILAIVGPEPVMPPPGFRVAENVEKYDFYKDKALKTCLVLRRDGKVIFKEGASFRPLTKDEEDRYERMPGKVVEREFRARFDEKSSFRVDDGWLCTVDMGEWGGGVYWFSRDWKSQEKLFTGNAKNINQMKGGLYCLGGLAHMGVQDGYLLSITKTKGRWIASKVCDLPSAPEASCTFDNSTFLFALSDVYSVNTKGQVTKLFPLPKELDLINTIQVQKSYVYVGGRKYVAAIRLSDPKGKIDRWYEPIPSKRDRR